MRRLPVLPDGPMRWADGGATSISAPLVPVAFFATIAPVLPAAMRRVDRAVQRIAEAVGSRDGSRGAVAAQDSPNLAAMVAEMTQRAEVLRREIATYMEAARGIAA